MNNKSIKSERKFFGQPFGLLNLFSTEFCERFSYYGMRAILVFYIYATVAEGGLGLSKQDALYVMTLFGASVYLLSVIGGWFADRVLGSHQCVFIGGIIIACGHIILSLPISGVIGTYIALICIALGTGLLKPNVSQMVGDLYDEGDRRRQAGFNLFVMGINFGSLLSPLITGYVQVTFGYHFAFSIPAIFMIIALVIYKGLASRHLENISRSAPHPLTYQEAKTVALRTIICIIIMIIFTLIFAHFGILTLESFSILMPVVSFGIVIFLFVQMFLDKSVTKVEKNHVKAYIAIFVGGTIFWAIEELQSSIFALLAEDRADRFIFGFETPSAWLQSINPFVIIIFAPILALVWTKWKKQPNIYIKGCIGLFLTAIAFIIPAIAFKTVASDAPIPLLLLCIPIILFSIGELFVSPIGLSSTTELAPSKYQSRLMSIWFLANTCGQGINAFCVRFFDEYNPANFFLGYAVVTFVVIAIICLMMKTIVRLSGDIK